MTVPHVMSRKAYSQAVRGHLIADALHLEYCYAKGKGVQQCDSLLVTYDKLIDGTIRVGQ